MNAFANPWQRALALMVVGMLSVLAPYALSSESTEQHAHHQPRDVFFSTANYPLPDVSLVREDGRTVLLKNELDDGRPVVLTFIFTSCTSICPLVSQTLSQLQGELGPDRDRIHMLSISIDPEHDTPARLRQYAMQFGAGPEWHHYTGTVAASAAAQRAFNVYHEDKMDHGPVILLRASPGKPWLRVEGFATADELMHAYRDLVASR